MKIFKYLGKALSLMALFVYLSGCDDNDCGSPPPVPVITFDDPIFEGEDLIIIARGDDNHTYKWIGPNSYAAEGRIQELLNVQISNSGSYTTQVSEGDCPSVSNTVNITVQPLPIPCEIDRNTLTLDANSGDYNHITCGENMSNGKFEMQAVYNDGPTEITIITVTFPTTSSPFLNQSFGILSSIDDLTVSDVSIKLRKITNGEVIDYFSSGSRLYIRNDNLGFDAHFCSVVFKKDGLPSIVATSRIRCDF